MRSGAIAIAVCGLNAFTVPPCAAQSGTRASPEACAGKLGAIESGTSQDVEGDVDWLGTYCDPATREKAVNIIASATADAALADTVSAHHDATQQARSDIGEINSAASNANAGVLANAMVTTPQLSPTVVVTNVHISNVPAAPHPVAPSPKPPSMVEPHSDPH